MRKLAVTYVEEKEQEVEEDQWMKQIMTHVDEKEEEECPWMMHLLSQVDWEDKEDQEGVDR